MVIESVAWHRLTLQEVYCSAVSLNLHACLKWNASFFDSGQRLAMWGGERGGVRGKAEVSWRY